MRKFTGSRNAGRRAVVEYDCRQDAVGDTVRTVKVGGELSPEGAFTGMRRLFSLFSFLVFSFSFTLEREREMSPLFSSHLISSPLL